MRWDQFFRLDEGWGQTGSRWPRFWRRRKRKQGAGGRIHLQFVIVFLGGTDGHNEVDPVLWGEAL